MSAALLTLQSQLIAIERERAVRGWFGGDLVGRRAKAKRLFVEAAVAAGSNPREAWDTANQCQDEAWHAAQQGDLFAGQGAA